ncbi:glycosyl hydrolase [Streptomyces sp. B21-083]|uniref:glycosyl hydrolase n=1 Tax=Streptomyces sp. B21-083 TaxID=3039410 RepID=UPI002FF1DDA3
MRMSTGYPTERVLSAGAVAALLLVTSVQSVAAQSVPSPTPAAVSVDFGSQQGELPRPERLNNFGNVTAWPDQRAGDVRFLNKHGLHGDVYRVWLSSPNAPDDVNVFNMCDLATNSCDLTKLDAYLTDASTVSDSLLVNLNPTAFVEGKRPLKDLRPMVELILRSVKKAYPKVKYVEAFNEPDWQFHGMQRQQGRPADQTTLQPGDLYRYYVPFYEAVDKVNQRLGRENRIELGGPALMWMDPKWMKPFLDDFAADRNRNKRLDFISYHAYLSWDDNYRVPTMYNTDLRVVASQRDTLRGWLKERRIDARTPSYVTETGIYPGPAYDDTDPRKDYLRQAAGMATYGYYFAGQRDTYMFNWCVRHRVEERKDQLVSRTTGGPATDTFTPYGNMMLMQSRMKDTRVSAVSDAVDGDNGVYAIASKDRTGASLMVWNWQHTKDQSYRATIDMSRMPSELRHGPVRRLVYRIDSTTSNYFGDPGRAELQLVDSKPVRPGRTYTETVDLAPNAIYLILLERA